jgi:hypothetical protein
MATDASINKRRKYHLNSTMYTTPKSSHKLISDHGNASPFPNPTMFNNNNNNNEQLMERIRSEAKRLIRRRQCQQSPTTQPIAPDASSTTSDATPLFTMAQVNTICEKLLHEREAVLREQYDLILSQKLNEQYDAFVKFTHEQIQKKFENSQFAYVS